MSRGREAEALSKVRAGTVEWVIKNSSNFDEFSLFLREFVKIRLTKSE
jgi:hypothetical protein